VRLYASLVGPLCGLYYPLPACCKNPLHARLMMNQSRLRSLWHSLYTEAEADAAIALYGGMKLPAGLGEKLDYDSFVVEQLLEELTPKFPTLAVTPPQEDRSQCLNSPSATPPAATPRSPSRA
jgi:hypothetical protein